MLSVGSGRNACLWLNDAKVNLNDVWRFEIVQRVRFILILQSILR